MVVKWNKRIKNFMMHLHHKIVYILNKNNYDNEKLNFGIF